MKYRQAQSLRNVLDTDVNTQSLYLRDNLAELTREHFGIPNGVVSGCAVTLNGNSGFTVASGLFIISGVWVQTTGSTSFVVPSADAIYYVYATLSEEYRNLVKQQRLYDISSGTYTFKNYYSKMADVGSITYSTTNNTSGCLFSTLVNFVAFGLTAAPTGQVTYISQLYPLLNNALSSTGYVASTTGTLVSSISTQSGVQAAKITTTSGNIDTLSGTLLSRYRQNNYPTATPGNPGYTDLTASGSIASGSFNTTTGFTTFCCSINANMENQKTVTGKLYINGVVVISGIASKNFADSSTTSYLNLNLYYVATNTSGTWEFIADFTSSQTNPTRCYYSVTEMKV